MPGILTNALDLWGFYNGKTDNSDGAFLPTEVDLEYDEHLVSDIKNPDSSFSIAGTLKSVTYPTGGRTEFEYEANTASMILLRTHLPSAISNYALPPTQIDTTSYLDKEFNSGVFIHSLYDFYRELRLSECGGVRIKSIADFSDTVCINRRTYSYNIPGSESSSGIVLKFNRYFSSHIEGIDIYDPDLKFPDGSLDKHHVAYSYVTEHMPDGSYTTYQYTDYTEYPDGFSENKTQCVCPLGHTGRYANFINNILREPDSRQYRRGQLKSIKNYNGGGDLVLRREYNYDDSDDSYVAYIVGSGDYWWSAKRFTCDFLLTSMKETRYQKGSISTRRVFNYNSNGQKIYEATLSDDGKYGTATYYRYCYENPTLTIPSARKMAPSDIVNVKIRNGIEQVIGNYEYIYDSEKSHIYPIEIKEYCIKKPISFNSDSYSIDDIVSLGRTNPIVSTSYTYNSQNRLIQIYGPGGTYMTLEWDEDMNNVVRKEVNASSNSYVYQWKDMVGLSSLTNPVGLTEIYGYDYKNRLESIKDDNGKMLKQYLYHLNHE